ncbi:MAG: non-heme iron oxygenase ferredoxin subunit [Planctomycetes bacterium]|nr:non-heme iron oxygenase ferredoxin subunit [Planctomycetota bacterium]
MQHYMKVATTADVPDPGKLTLEVGERIVVLFHVDGRFYCLDDVCTHDGGPLGDGRLDGHHVSCPRHGARFDIRTGKVLTMPATEDVTAHDVKIDGDAVLVRLSDN